ncbi:MAG TPA: hypothetical protein VFH73_22950 [Polyangia bacterium]|jgi:hypothetical protein|nr:hypothetical protein [Polyangia bacterium]
MTLKALFSLVSGAVLLTVLATAGCGGSTSPKGGAAGSGGSSDGPIRGEVTGSGGSGDVDAASEGAAGGTTDDGGVAGSGGGAGGTGGTVADGSADKGGGGTGGAADAARDMSVVPRVCQAGEMCTGTYMCNVTARCIRGEREVCHCINDSLFCGPAACDTPDANTIPDARPDAMMTPMCPVNTQTGDNCDSTMDRMCDTTCIAGRQRVCFCNSNTDNWICTNFNRCQ